MHLLYSNRRSFKVTLFVRSLVKFRRFFTRSLVSPPPPLVVRRLIYYTTLIPHPHPSHYMYTSGLKTRGLPCGVRIALVGCVTAITRRAALDLVVALAAAGCLSACGQAEDGEDDGVGLHLWVKGPSTGCS